MRFTLASLVVMCCRAQQNDHKTNRDYHSGTRSSPTPTEIAEQANALFAKDDDGVIFRMVHPDLIAIDKDEITRTTMSFGRLNKYAWGDGIIQLFKDGARPALIAKPHANEHVKCQYPCDGSTIDRYDKCHVTGCPCDASGKDDWCDHELHGEKSKPCAFKRDETAKMMKAFRDVKAGTSPLLKNQACGFYHTPSQSHNEVIIDPRTWNAHIKDNLWAFVLTDACTGACETSLRRLHDGAKKKYGDIPILSFNRKDKEHPFHTNAADEKAGGASETEENEGSIGNASAVELGGLASMDVIV